jgi:Uma2 family endonuclease
MIPDLSKYQTEDHAPVDSFYCARQQILLVDALTSSWAGPGGGRRFFVTKNVGLFHTANQPPVVPDVMLALDVEFGTDYSLPENRSYFQWVIGKPPDLVIEMVSPTPGGEDTDKLQLYARIGVPYYAIFDPEHFLSPTELRVFARSGRRYRPIEPGLIEDLGLGLLVWEGTYGGDTARWMRWMDASGTLIPTGAERAAAAEQAADAAALRAKAAAQRADREKQRADELEVKLARYAAKLRDAGLSPNGE